MIRPVSRIPRVALGVSLLLAAGLAAGTMVSADQFLDALAAEDRRDHALEEADELLTPLQEAHQAALGWGRTGDDRARARGRDALERARIQRPAARMAMAAANGPDPARAMDQAAGRLADLLSRLLDAPPRAEDSDPVLPLLAYEAERDLRARLTTARATLLEASREVHRRMPRVGAMTLALLAVGTLLLVAAFASRRRAWTVAERNARHLQALLDNAPAVIQVKDLEGRYVLVSRGFMEIHGRPAADILGRTPWDLLPPDTARKVLANDRAALAAGGPLQREESMVLGGQERAFLVTKFPLRDDRGQAYGVCGISFEVTARRQAEEALRQSEARLRTLFDEAPVAISMLRDGRYFYLNPAMAALFGLASPAEGIGRTPFDLVEPEARPALAERLARFERDEPNPPEFATTGLRPDGTAFPCHVVSRRAVFPDGPAVIAFIRDMTAVHRAHRELRDFAARLQRSNRELQDYAHVASHDLKEPLRKIRMFGDRLAHRLGVGLDEESRDDLARMIDAATRMQALVDSLLSLSRVTMADEPFRPVDLAEVARTVLSDLEPSLQESGAQVEVDALPAVQGDAVQMRQLFQNLLGNALKFRVPGRPPQVRIGSRSFRAPAPGAPDDGPGQDWCEVTFQDNGIGFDDQHAERIFGVFQRLHGRASYEGTGIGLAVCRRIVERHGGTIVARGVPGQGATFRISLPVAGPIREAAS